MAFIRKIKKKSGTYLAKVESYRKDGKIKQRVLEYLGKEIEGRPAKRINTSDIIVKNVKRSLDILAIDKIAEELKLKLMQNRYILSLIYSHLLEKRSINKLEEWMRYTEIPEILEINDVSTKILYESLGDISEEDFNKMNLSMQEVFEDYEKISDAAVIDVTDTYFEGNSEEIKRRKGKDGKVRRLVQLGLATSFKNGFPIFYKKYHGNLNGIHVFRDMALELKNKNLKSIIIDRGMMSFENMKLIKSLELELIGGLRKNKTLVDDFVSKINREDIYTLKNRVALKNTSVFINSFDYMEGRLIVVYNPSLEVIKKEINFEKGNDNNSDIGYSLIYHNTKYADEEVIRKYYDKEIIERAFKQLKGVLNLRPIRVWLKEHKEGHIMICYLAYAILSLMNYKLKKSKISAIDALDVLKHGYRVSLFDKKNNHEWNLLVQLTPKQKELLDCLGVVYKN
ncbi:MAG: transposase [Candidatus Melainabacteria bacterium]|nr:transposase [Candidatus Melainabacteria bacterium]